MIALFLSLSRRNSFGSIGSHLFIYLIKKRTLHYILRRSINVSLFVKAIVVVLHKRIHIAKNVLKFSHFSAFTHIFILLMLCKNFSEIVKTAERVCRNGELIIKMKTLLTYTLLKLTVYVSSVYNNFIQSFILSPSQTFKIPKH